MASKQSIVDFILEQISSAGVVSARKMFGEYSIYCDGKVVALVCDDRLFVKQTHAGKEFIGTYEEAAPYPKAKPYFVIDEEKWNESEWLSRLIKLSAEQIPIRTKTLTRKSAPKIH